MMIHFTIGPNRCGRTAQLARLQRKARDSNPHLLVEALISSEARQTVSGCLPYQVDSPGIEPGSPPRQGSVFPLDHEPVFIEWT